LAVLTKAGDLKLTLLRRDAHAASAERWAIRYLALLAGSLLGLAALTAAATILIDPYYLFGTPRIAGFNWYKPAAYNRGVAAKVALLERMHPRTLLVGNSRIEVGFDPQSLAWPAAMRPVFDGGLGGSVLGISAKVIEDAAADPTLHYVMVGVDFLDFMSVDAHAPPPGPVDAGPDADRMRVLPDLSPNPVAWRARIEDRLGATLTLGAVTDSFNTLLDQWHAYPATLTPQGFNPLEEYKIYVKLHGFRDLFDQKQVQYSAWFARYPHPDFAHPYRTDSFRALREIIQVAQRRNLDLTLIIYPYHAWVLDLLLRDGLWTSFENWKRALVEVVATLDPAHRVRIVDFSGFNTYSTEHVPAAGDTKTIVQYYWEPGHFRPSLGNAMIRRLYDGDAGSFGQTLTPATVDQVIRSMRAEAALLSQQAASNSVR
jgi:hypothetical protein